MSLPARQQRILDGIGDTLRISEPRLAAMFAIFTRLHRNEPEPSRERLARPMRATWLAALTGRLPDWPASGLRRNWRRMLVLSQVAVAIIVLLLVAGLTAHDPPGCGSTRVTRGAVSALRDQDCPAQSGAGVASLGK
jgi:hypothetical protein